MPRDVATVTDDLRPNAYEKPPSAVGTRAAAAGGDDPFADEVAIDFPSMARAVERIRRALVGAEESDAPLTAELRLSRLDALEGVTVPLELPVRGICPRCGGRGEVWMESCGGCGGTGAWHRRHSVEVPVPARTADGATLRVSVAFPPAPPTTVEVRIAVG